MSGTIRRGTPPRRAAPPRRRKPPKVSMLDRLVRVLPISEATLHTLMGWAIFLFFGAAVIAVATWFGIPGMVGTAVAESAGRAGFRVEQIEVTGLKRMDRMSVYAVALDQQSRAMPLVDLEAVRQKLKTYGWIEDAHVSRRLPDTLLVDIVERKPSAVWQNQGQLTLIDAGGVLLEPVRPDAMPDLPLVIGPGANLQEPAYQNLLEAAPALRPLVRAANWVGNRRWDILFTSGETLMLPEGVDEARRTLIKFAEMDGTDRLLGKGWLRFDLRDPDKLVARRPGQAVRKPVATDDEKPAPSQDAATTKAELQGGREA
ncbi:hypothetical protein BH09PSE4_BH09PSE4_09670 [soil metagenome]